MKAMLFLLLVLGGVVVIFLVMNKITSSDIKGHGQKTRKAGLPLGGPMPGNNVLAHNDAAWQARREHLRNPGQLDGQTAYYARSEDEPEYDGYSRRDRHHLTPAHIKDEVEYEYLSMSSVKFKTKDEPKSAGKMQRKA